MTPSTIRGVAAVSLVVAAAIGIGSAVSKDDSLAAAHRVLDTRIETQAQQTLLAGRRIFRQDTFGSQAFWGDTLRLHEAIAGRANGGVGMGLSPEAALGLGLKVDANALPGKLRADLRHSRVDLTDPAITIALLQLNAVVGVRGFFDDSGTLQSVGITCALCHSDVDDSFAPGIGRRLDGWAARDLDVGAIIAFAPNLQPFVDLLRIVDPTIDAAAVRAVLRGWGPGKFDAELVLDGKTSRPDGGSSATLIPPAFGLAGINLHTWTGWGSVPHWNGFVANLEMQGQGTFYDPRLDDAAKFPIAATTGAGNVRNTPDLITAKLPALHYYQLSLPAPRARHGSFNLAAAQRGKVLFRERAGCARCHVPPLFTEPGWNMHTPDEIGIDGFQAERSPDERYRTAPLKGLWTHTRGGFYHDGRFPTLRAVIDHYDTHFALGLSAQERTDLAEYLKSI
jgi:hypothetical protein